MTKRITSLFKRLEDGCDLVGPSEPSKYEAEYLRPALVGQVLDEELEVLVRRSLLKALGGEEFEHRPMEEASLIRRWADHETDTWTE